MSMVFDVSGSVNESCFCFSNVKSELFTIMSVCVFSILSFFGPEEIGTLNRSGGTRNSGSEPFVVCDV